MNTQTELQKAVERWVEAKRQQVLREDTKGDLQHEVRCQERDVEDAITAELEEESRLSPENKQFLDEVIKPAWQRRK